MPVKKTKKPRTRRAPAKKKGLKQKQKQKQIQKVNVQVSSGGSGGGGTQFIPMPSAPVFDYAQLASLIRPAATVDIPIRAQANPEPLPAREAAAPSLTSEISTQTGPSRPAPPTPKADAPKVRKARTKVPIFQRMTEREAGYETFPSSESETGITVRKKEGQAASMFRKYGGSFEEE